MFGCHMHDILSACEPEGQKLIDELLVLVAGRTVSEFRFCGVETDQDDDFNVCVGAKDNAEKTMPIYDP